MSTLKPGFSHAKFPVEDIPCLVEPLDESGRPVILILIFIWVQQSNDPLR